MLSPIVMDRNTLLPTEEPPPKKARFFTSNSDENSNAYITPSQEYEQRMKMHRKHRASNSINSVSSNGSNDSVDSKLSSSELGKEEYTIEEDPLKEPNIQIEEDPNLPIPIPSPSKSISPSKNGEHKSKIGFDEETLSAIIGEKISPQTITILRDMSGDNVERAINMYYDGSLKSYLNASSISSTSKSQLPKQNHLRDSNEVASIRTNKDVKKSTDQHQTSVIKNVKDTQSINDSQKRNRKVNVQSRIGVAHEIVIPWTKKYIGCMGCEGWASVSGRNLLEAGEKITLDRLTPSSLMSSQSQTPKSKGSSKLGSSPISSSNSTKSSNNRFQFASSASSATSKKQNVVVRFKNSKGVEVGRLPQNVATFVSTLLDLEICHFEGECIYLPQAKVKIGDNILLQLRCYILKNAFNVKSSAFADDDLSAYNNNSESMEEMKLKLRRIALLTLLHQINLEPVRSSEILKKQRQKGIEIGIDQVAEHFQKSEQHPVSSPPSDDQDGQEVEQDQLDSLYRKAQMYDTEMDGLEPSTTFTYELRKYQKQALRWMSGKENLSDNMRQQSESLLHPLWEEYVFPDEDAKAKPSDALPFYLNPYSGELSLEFPKAMTECRGGILADEMGLGKTIEMLSLIHTNLPGNSTVEEDTMDNRIQCPATLVIAPMSLLSQWHSESEKSSKAGAIKSSVYYGDERALDLRMLAKSYNAASPNILITSYGTVLSEYGKLLKDEEQGIITKGDSLFRLHFHRIILDEAHVIRNRNSKTAKACYALASDCRWALTGTPIVNKLEDLYSLVKYLRLDPWQNFAFWKTFITNPFEQKEIARALDVVQSVLEPLVLRRTKDMKDAEGNPIVALPEKTISLKKIVLSEEERTVYDFIFNKAKRSFAENVAAGTVFRNYTHILAMLLRLRQSCCHPTLVKIKEEDMETDPDLKANDPEANEIDEDLSLQTLLKQFEADTSEGNLQKKANQYGAHILKQIQEDSENECAICSAEPIVNQAVTPCWHMACKECLVQNIQFQKSKGEVPRCHICREEVNLKDILDVVRYEGESNESEDEIFLRKNTSYGSSKLNALIEHLREIRRAEPQSKTIVFSQFTSYLDLIEKVFKKEKLRYSRLDGSVDQKSRAKILSTFDSYQGGMIMLISLKAGGVGLNLTAANRCFLMDPWWSFAVEAQAIDRIHRMGQIRPVNVYRFIVENSVEEKMLKIQERKSFISASSLGMSKEEKQVDRIEQIKMLFE